MPATFAWIWPAKKSSEPNATRRKTTVLSYDDALVDAFLARPELAGASRREVTAMVDGAMGGIVEVLVMEIEAESRRD